MQVEAVWATGPPQEERIALEARISHEAVVETGMPLAEVPGDTTDRARETAAVVVPPACRPGEAEASVAVAEAEVEVEEGEGERHISPESVHESTAMDTRMTSPNRIRFGSALIAGALARACLCVSPPASAQQSGAAKTSASDAPTTPVKSFASPQQAADSLIDAASKFDIAALIETFGPGGEDIVFSGEFAQDRKHAADFVAEAREKKSVSVASKAGNRAFVLVGNEDWPFPVPIVKRGEKWFFDAKAGRQELLYRRIGADELDAIAICHGYVEAQYDYAFRKRQGYEVNQYAQRIISTPGTQDGLAWKDSDGTWAGPIGEKIARAIQQGYTIGADPYHGYFFKILKGQGPAAPLGEMDYVVKGVMIGGFALAAVPAEYAVTGVRSFLVSQDGIVYEKDMGPKSIDEFNKMERFNPDKSWAPAQEAESTSD